MSGELGILLQARMSSARLPGKSLRKIGENPLIHYVVQHLKPLNLPFIACTSDQPSDESLVEYLAFNDIEYFRGSLSNVLQRYISAAEAFGIQKIVRVTGDNPLIDVKYLEKSLHLFNSYEYVDGIYSGGLIKGTGFELVTLSALKSIPSKKEEHLEHVTSWLRENPNSIRLTQLKPNQNNKYREDICLSCDYERDLELLEKIFQHFNYRTDLRIEEVVTFLADHPSLKEINKCLHH